MCTRLVDLSRRITVAVFLTATLGGCATSNNLDGGSAGRSQGDSGKQSRAPIVADAELLQRYMSADERFDALTRKVRQNPGSVEFFDFWEAYLDTSYLHSAVDVRAEFQQELAALASGKDGECTQIDWAYWSQRNFMELEPHLAAQACYESIGETALALQHENSVQYILRGVLGSGDGASIDTAYEIALLDHAEEILQLAGYRVRDALLQPVASGIGLIYIVIAEDPDTGVQHEFYFENQRVINVLLGATYPFAGVGGNYVPQVLRPLAEGGVSSAQIGLGRLLEETEDVEGAARQYASAISSGSEIAQLRLGVAALKGVLPGYSRENAVDLLITSAEQGSANAMVALAFVYQQGLGVEPSEVLSEQFMAAASQRLEPGKAWLLLSAFYLDEELGSSVTAGMRYVKKAAAEGYLPARRIALQAELNSFWEEADLDALLPPLQELAEAGDIEAGVIYARRVLTAPASQAVERVLNATRYLEGALAVHSDMAYALQGDIHRSNREYVAARASYLRGASATASQLGMALLHQQQRLPDSDPVHGSLWFMMCGSHGDSECLYQLGSLFLSGEGVDRDPETARQAFHEAAMRGHSRAQLALERLERNL